MKYLAFNSAGYDSRGFNMADSSTVGRLAGAVSRIMELTARIRIFGHFFSAGGKLIMYHGWSDPAMSPLATVKYYSSVAKQLHCRSPRCRHMRGCSWFPVCIIVAAVPVPTYSIR